MADFRRLLYAFAIVALLVGFTVPASAQSVLMTCTGSANNPLIRGEDYTAQAGDIFIQCSGGIPTATGTTVPKVDITVFTTTTTITTTTSPDHLAADAKDKGLTLPLVTASAVDATSASASASTSPSAA